MYSGGVFKKMQGRIKTSGIYFDTEPTKNSNNAVTSQGIKKSLIPLNYLYYTMEDYDDGYAITNKPTSPMWQISRYRQFTNIPMNCLPNSNINFFNFKILSIEKNEVIILGVVAGSDDYEQNESLFFLLHCPFENDILQTEKIFYEWI